eukprot:6914672-Pyramimonas_sp.AAC.1
MKQFSLFAKCMLLQIVALHIAWMFADLVESAAGARPPGPAEAAPALADAAGHAPAAPAGQGRGGRGRGRRGRGGGRGRARGFEHAPTTRLNMKL